MSTSERLLRSVLDSLEMRMCVVGLDGRVMDTNRTWDELAERCGRSTGVGEDFFALLQGGALTGMDTLPLQAAVHDILVDGLDQVVELKTTWTPARRREHAVIRVYPVRDHEFARAVVSMVDITTPIRVQRKLQQITERAQLLALVAEHTDNGVAIEDGHGQIEWVNTAFTRMTGYGAKEIIGRKGRELWRGPFARSPEFQQLYAALDAGGSIDTEFRTEDGTGRSYWTHLQVQPIRAGTRITRYVSIQRDVTPRRSAQEQLRAAHEQMSTLAEEMAGEKSILSGVLGAIPHLVYWKTDDLRYAGVNNAFLELRGFAGPDEVIGRLEGELGVTDALADLLPELEQEVLGTGRPKLDLSVALVLPQGRRDLLLSVLPWSGQGQGETGQAGTGVLGVAADLTRASELERHLAQASRMEAIGQLAAGIAHEINTPVQYVSDNTIFVSDVVGEVLGALRTVIEACRVDRADGPDPDAARAALATLDLDFLSDEIPSALTQSLEGLERVAEIVRAMKDFSHPGSDRVETDLNRAIGTTVQVCRNEWKYVADLELDLDPTIGGVPCYEGELKQVLLNMIVNAAQAIAGDPARDLAAKGTIRVATRRPADENVVQIEITDDGPGMEESVQRRIFDPFFTTKGVGLGTGQGLNLAYSSIVLKHGGRIDVRSAPGAGATFVITLPLTVSTDPG